ncbi:cytochrome C assembly family protein [Methylocaldum sp.]|uniref:cytochrome C assembly family protein n=1 Tax=Methylocaldum sp. TaxID=1969727 RepID=UPI002D5A56AB|nr:cytochrome c biogenesis protein CcsA [Methylocaldum sp.]HYE35219.1 cytochrome c biogenesis protein CcsA [Methylocaldum sp.]
MNSTLFGALAIATYAVAAITLIRSLHDTDYPPGEMSGVRRLKTLALGWLAAVLHGIALTGAFETAEGLNLSFLSAMSLVAWVIVAILLLTALAKPVDKLGMVIFPLAALILLLKLSVPESIHTVRNQSWPMTTHIVVSMLAYSFLNIAAFQATLLALQDWRLRSHHTDLLVRSLPPLQTMESLLFQLIAAGFVLLSASLLTGFIFLEDMFAQHLAHKTVLSILAWILFGVLLIGRARYGWRGTIAIRWTLGGFLSLMLAYFGSKMVLEWILNRA